MGVKGRERQRGNEGILTKRGESPKLRGKKFPKGLLSGTGMGSKQSGVNNYGISG